jgi:large subunit ribosomal protein L6
MHGTTRQLIFNAIEGVTNGFSKHLEIIGVGYNAKSQKNRVVLQLGFSHDIIFDLPEGIEAISDGKKNEKLEIKGINKQAVGQVAAKIRSLRKPERYKGKGIRYKDEYVRSKQGKTVGGGD